MSAASAPSLLREIAGERSPVLAALLPVRSPLLMILLEPLDVPAQLLLARSRAEVLTNLLAVAADRPAVLPDLLSVVLQVPGVGRDVIRPARGAEGQPEEDGAEDERQGLHRLLPFSL